MQGSSEGGADSESSEEEDELTIEEAEEGEGEEEGVKRYVVHPPYPHPPYDFRVLANEVPSDPQFERSVL